MRRLTRPPSSVTCRPWWKVHAAPWYCFPHANRCRTFDGPTETGASVLYPGNLSKQETLNSTRRGRWRDSSVLFGLASFAEGVDLPGAYCEHVVIAKIPFSVPDDLVEAALAEWIEARAAPVHGNLGTGCFTEAGAGPAGACCVPKKTAAPSRCSTGAWLPSAMAASRMRCRHSGAKFFKPPNSSLRGLSHCWSLCHQAIHRPFGRTCSYDSHAARPFCPAVRRALDGRAQRATNIVQSVRPDVVKVAT